MAKTKQDEIIVGLDIGTTTISAIVGEVTEDGVDIIGIGTSTSRGLRKGVVVNIDATVQAIQRAIVEAENMAGCEIQTVYAGIAGGHIRGMNSHGVVAVKDKEVGKDAIGRVIEAAKAQAIPMDREILHVLPQQYLIDSQDGIRDPLGMSGVRLEAKVHIVTTSVSCAQNVVKCANRCGLQVADIVLEPLASAEAVIEEDEKELGVALIDVGGGTTDIVIFVDGAIVHSAVLPLGGSHVTNDIAVGLRTPLEAAEKIKKKYGCAQASLVDDGEQIEVPSVGGRDPRKMARRFLVEEIIEPRVEEMFEHVKKELIRSGYWDSIAAGCVLTGGATSLDGTPDVAEEVLGLPCRRGQPERIGGLIDVVRSPSFATGVGLVMYGAGGDHQPLQVDSSDRRGMFRRMGSWIREIF
ncbi:MAG: cell division protein FtsA [Deltaproteobacteria bacterium]|jgi:cell division protein FtsA|nr:cell division protein FtsA [Deltaproteobacteria bacterium]